MKSKKENNEAKQEHQKLETSKKAFLKELNQIKFELREKDLEDSKKIKGKIINPCEKLRKAIEEYKSKNKKKSKITEIIKSRLNEKYLNKITNDINGIELKSVRLNPTLLKRKLNDLRINLINLRKSIKLPSTDNKKIKSCLDIMSKELKSAISTIQQTEKQKKAEPKTKPAQLKVYYVEIKGKEKTNSSSAYFISVYQIHFVPYDDNKTFSEIKSKLQNYKLADKGIDFYNKLKKNYSQYEFNEEYNNSNDFLIDHKNIENFLQEFKKWKIENIELLVQNSKNRKFELKYSSISKS